MRPTASKSTAATTAPMSSNARMRWELRQQVYETEMARLLKELDYIKRNISGQRVQQAKGKLRRLSREVQAIEALGFEAVPARAGWRSATRSRFPATRWAWRSSSAASRACAASHTPPAAPAPEPQSQPALRRPGVAHPRPGDRLPGRRAAALPHARSAAQARRVRRGDRSERRRQDHLSEDHPGADAAPGRRGRVGRQPENRLFCPGA